MGSLTLVEVRRSVRRLMVIVALIALALAIARPIIRAHHWTIDAAGYDEDRFRQIRIGIAAEQVERWMGPPLRKWPWTDRIEVWADSDQGLDTSSYHRRWLPIEGGTVHSIEHSYSFD